MRIWLLLILVLPLNVAISAHKASKYPTKDVEIQVSGVLVSTSSRSALINGRVAREGERVSGVEILAIDEDGVHVRYGSGERMVDVGSTVRLAASSPRPPEPVEVARPTDPSEHRVSAGETLSQIAEQFAGPGASLEQVMMAMFDMNPQAFNGNINRLRAGAVLKIPSATDMQRRSPDFALAQVLQQTESWRGGTSEAEQKRANDLQPPVMQVVASVEIEPPVEDTVPDDSVYGPIGYGETLSEIALRLAGNGITMHQMMSALFEENPDAFGGSIDFLREGAVLRIPTFDSIDPNTTLAASRY